MTMKIFKGHLNFARLGIVPLAHFSGGKLLASAGLQQKYMRKYLT